MPIYEYRCHNCRQDVEVLLLNRGDSPTCPHCGAALSEKRITAAHHRTASREAPAEGLTCCGREERCDSPACGSGGCWRNES